jgi:hypothetical protein
MFNFTPEASSIIHVPYFDDVSRDEGWQGYSTTKPTKKLQAEIGDAIGRLGGIVSSFQRGTFIIDNQTREGYRVHYSIQNPNTRLVLGRIDVAALPVRNKRDETRKDKSLRMALYMLRNALDGMWFMQQLSPGYAALMPWMLADGDRTVSQLWSDSPIMSNLLPPPDSEFVIDG